MTAATKSAPKAVKAAAKRPARPDPKPSVKAAQASKSKGVISTPGEKPADLYESVKDVPSVPTTEVAHPNRVERVKLAKAEFAALKAWKTAGAKAPRPATPNLDAINRGESGSTAGSVASRAMTTKTDVHPKIAAARAAAKAGARGKGKAITEAELTDWIKALRVEVPGVTRSQAQQINWWVDGYACGIGRFNTAWDATV